MYALKDVLPDQHLHYWQSFVLACRHLCKPCITKTDLIVSDWKLLHFLKEYEKINRELAITPNMHLHLHLKECVENYGSIYGFWRFSFERYNGILGSYHKNSKTVEIQIMVHSVEIKGKQTIHASAVVNWLKSSEQDLGLNPLCLVSRQH